MLGIYKTKIQLTEDELEKLNTILFDVKLVIVNGEEIEMIIEKRER